MIMTYSLLPHVSCVYCGAQYTCTYCFLGTSVLAYSILNLLKILVILKDLILLYVRMLFQLIIIIYYFSTLFLQMLCVIFNWNILEVIMRSALFGLAEAVLYCHRGLLVLYGAFKHQTEIWQRSKVTKMYEIKFYAFGT